MNSKLARRSIIVTVLAMLFGSAMVTPALAGPAHYCLAIDGVVLEQRGSAMCSAGLGSYAEATGSRSYAGADTDSKATATGNKSYATAHNGSTAHASGNKSKAQAVDNSVAEATGTKSSATAITDGIALVYGDHGSALASNSGYAVANGACSVEAHFGATNTCTGP